MSLRERPPRRSLQRLGPWASAVLVVGVALVVFGGISHLFLGLWILVAGILALVGVAVRWFYPALAVSVVGVALSCASLMTALSVASGFEDAIVRAVTQLNGHVLLTKYGLDFFEYAEIADRWKRDDRVTAVSPFAYSMISLVPEKAKNDEDWAEPINALGKGLDPERARDLQGIERVMGRGDLSGLRPGDTRHVPGLVLGRRLATLAGLEVGDRVRVVVPAEIDGSGELHQAPRHAVFEVLDTVETGVSDIDREIALMHITAAQALFFREGRVTGIELELADPGLAAEIGAALEAELGPHFRSSTWEKANAPLLQGLRQIRAALALVLGLMVVVAATSLVASLLLLVRRKRPDIAVLLALGADGAIAFWAFEGVGLLAGGAGAVLGLLLGGAYCLTIWRYQFPLESDVYPIDHLPVMVGAWDAFGPAAVAVLLCGLASGPVAALASRTNILLGMQR